MPERGEVEGPADGEGGHGVNAGTREAATARPRRMSQELNEALHTLFAADERLFLLGEDVLDPYGGAFKISKGLSSSYPDRVLTTPLSENAVIGAANGLALCGNRVIAEIMFADFLALGFDQLLNFSAKSCSMYGTRTPMSVLVRTPVGGRRGYGPTHSQSPQKHFLGIPDLALYELSPFHAPAPLLEFALGCGVPGVLFEDKVLYSERLHSDGGSDGVRAKLVGAAPGWAHVFPVPGMRGTPDFVLLTPGGFARRAVAAAQELYRERGLTVELLVPAQLYPLDLDPVLPVLAAAGRVGVAEESAPGGTWGAEVERLVHERLWPHLRQPVFQLTSADSVVPTAQHLERRILLDDADVAAGVAGFAEAAGSAGATVAAADAGDGGPTVQPVDGDSAPQRPAVNGSAPALREATAPPVPQTEPDPGGAAAADGTAPYAVVAPKLNNNDDAYLLTNWLAEHGAWVEAGTPLLVLETSKAAEEIEAPVHGFVRHAVHAGEECAVGRVLGHLHADLDDLDGGEPAAVERADPGSPTDTGGTAEAHAGVSLPANADAADPGDREENASLRPGTRTHHLSRAQAGTAATVSRSHAEVPTAFTAARFEIGTVLRRLDAYAEESGGDVGLPEAFVKAVAEAFDDFPLLFGSLMADGTVAVPESPQIGVTLDAGSGLFVPVVRGAREASLDEVADVLMDYQFKAFGDGFSAAELAGGNMTLSLNTEPEVEIVHPIVLWPQLCMLTLNGVREEPRLDDDGALIRREFVNVGLVYDHRVVNGRDATLFLRRVRTTLDDDALWRTRDEPSEAPMPLRSGKSPDS